MTGIYRFRPAVRTWDATQRRNRARRFRTALALLGLGLALGAGFAHAWDIESDYTDSGVGCVLDCADPR